MGGGGAAASELQRNKNRAIEDFCAAHELDDDSRSLLHACGDYEDLIERFSDKVSFFFLHAPCGDYVEDLIGIFWRM